MCQKKFEELKLRDDFMFGKVMRNKAICKKNQGKSVRLDVYVEDDRRVVYNAEMQQKDDDENIRQLPKRSRYYQGMIDLNLIEKGFPYAALNTSYVIFICTFDPFGKGQYQYTFRALCQEDTSYALEDETTRIFFNTKGNLEEAPEELRELLQYIETNQSENTFTKQLDHEVECAKQNEKWRREYMKELLHDFDMKEEGRREGEQKVNRLNQLLAEKNRTEDIIRAAQDEEYQKKLFEEFQI